MLICTVFSLESSLALSYLLHIKALGLDVYITDVIATLLLLFLPGLANVDSRLGLLSGVLCTLVTATYLLISPDNSQNTFQ